MNWPGVLFLSVDHAARSQIAEGLARQRFGDRLRILGAGIRPTQVHELAIATLAKVGIELETPRTVQVDDVDPAEVDLVISFCDTDACAGYFPKARHLRWPIEDPLVERPGDSSSPFGADAMRSHRFRRARLQIEARLDLLAAALKAPPDIVLEPATEKDRAGVESLLRAASLPLDGLDQCFPEQAVVARRGAALIGVAANERWQSFGLLRSVVVAEEYRRQHLATALVVDRICLARLEAYHSVYLLTTEAEGFFSQLGFTAIERSELPAALEPSSLLTIPRCASATAMKLQLADSSRTDALLDEHIAAEVEIEGTLVPPWEKFPSIRRGSIGWRMGAGEWYLWMWHRWWDGLEPHERQAYRKRWEAGAPLAWQDWLRGISQG